MFITELFTEAEEMRKLVAVFRKGPTMDNPKAVASKIYLWKTGPGDNTYEMEVGQDRKRIPVKLSFAQIRQTLAKKGFNESITRNGRLLIEAVIDFNKVKADRKEQNERDDWNDHPAIQLGMMPSLAHAAIFGIRVLSKLPAALKQQWLEQGEDYIKEELWKMAERQGVAVGPGWNGEEVDRPVNKFAKAKLTFRIEDADECADYVGDVCGDPSVECWSDYIQKSIGQIKEASMTKSEPSKKESVFNKGVEKSLGQQVAVIVLDHPDSVAYGVFKRIGETGLCHIKLNGGKLPGWAAGDMIAVRPSEVYSTWDPRIAGKTAVHREYDDQGNKTVREDNKWAKLPSGDYRNMDTGRAYAKKGGGPDNGGNSSYMTPEYMLGQYKERLAKIQASQYKRPREVAQLQKKIAKLSGVQEADAGISKGDETKFHKKLDTLVHDTFGKRNDE